MTPDRSPNPGATLGAATCHSQGLPSPPGPLAYVSALRAVGGALVSEKPRKSDRSSVGVALYASPPYDLDVPALPLSRLSITLTPAQVSGGLTGDRPRVYQSPRHAMFLAPAGAAAHWKKDAPSRHLTLYFDAEALADCELFRHRSGLGSAPLHNLGMPGLAALAGELQAELASSEAWSAEAADSLGRLLLIKLARHIAGPRSGSNPLTPQLLQRLVAHVQAHLSERLLVSDLAAVVGLSPNHFAQAFTACTRQAPHQFVMAQRLQRAQALLQEARLPLAEVAAECGFASQQHLTQRMRQQLGETPARYRRHAQQLAASPAAAGKANSIS